jgi:GxxExxY protein
MYFKLSKFFLYLAPLAVVIVSSSTLFPFIVGKYAFFRTAVSLSLVFFLLGVLFNNKYQPISTNINKYPSISISINQYLKNPLVVAVLAFVFVFVLAGFLGVNPAWSFWSNFERGEGGLQMLYLGVFFLLLILLFKEKSDWQKLFLISIIAAALMISYGVFAGLKYIDAEIVTTHLPMGGTEQRLTGEGGPLYQTFKSFIGPDFRDEGYRFAGSIGNPAYVAVYLVFIIFYALYLLIEKYRYRLKSAGAIGLMAVIIFFSIFFFLAATRGAFIGLIAAGLAGLVYLGFSAKKWRKWFLLAGVIALLAVGSLVYFRNTAFVKSLPGGRIFDISFQAENFQNRLVIWKIAFDGFKERPLLGWGPENFPVVFDKHYNVKHFKPDAEGFGAWYDRAHNVFLDYLTQAGIFGLLSFLAIFGIFYWQLLRRTRTQADFKQTQADFVGTRTQADFGRTKADDSGNKLLYEELTYKMRGAIFDIKKQLGLGHKEIVYQNALEEEFKKRNIVFEREKSIGVVYNGKKVGVYQPDFLVENKIVLELKSLPFLNKGTKKQMWHYLRGTPYHLALLVNFGNPQDVQIERIIRLKDLHSSTKSVLSPLKSALLSLKSATISPLKSVLSPLESALLFSLPIAYLVQGLALFDILPTYINLFLFLAFATYKFKSQNSNLKNTL